MVNVRERYFERIVHSSKCQRCRQSNDPLCIVVQLVLDPLVVVELSIARRSVVKLSIAQRSIFVAAFFDSFF